MVMEVMESLESSQIGDARELFGALVLPVVQQGEIVVSPAYSPKTRRAATPAGSTSPSSPQIASAPVMMPKSGVLMSALGSAWCCA